MIHSIHSTELVAMSAFNPKQKWPRALHMSAFRVIADMTICACLLLRSLLGVKRTWRFAAHMSAYDPKRTSDANPTSALLRIRNFPNCASAAGFCAIAQGRASAAYRLRPAL